MPTRRGGDGVPRSWNDTAKKDRKKPAERGKREERLDGARQKNRLRGLRQRILSVTTVKPEPSLVVSRSCGGRNEGRLTVYVCLFLSSIYAYLSLSSSIARTHGLFCPQKISCSSSTRREHEILSYRLRFFARGTNVFSILSSNPLRRSYKHDRVFYGLVLVLQRVIYGPIGANACFTKSARFCQFI